MQIRTGSTGVFLGCSGYTLPTKERCTKTLNLAPGEDMIAVPLSSSSRSVSVADDGPPDDAEAEVAVVDQGDEQESQRLLSKHKCPVCGTVMDVYIVDDSHKLHICGNGPDCAGFEVEEGKFRLKGYDGPTVECEKCQSDMQLKSGRFGRYFGCTNPSCKNTRKVLRSGLPAPPRADPIPMPELRCAKVDDHYVLRDGAAGLFLAASQFPKNRETRAPKVAELTSHGNELDAKHAYLLSAPVADPNGRPAIIRFSRKSAEHYVMSEIDDKASGWRAAYRDGRWVASVGEPKGGLSGKPDDAPVRKARAAPRKGRRGG